MEDLLFAHPNLIDPRLSGPRRQTVLSSDSRSDLLFETPNGAVQVEIKRDTIRPLCIAQVERYALRLRRPLKSARAILVAPDITPEAQRRLQASRLALTFKRLGVDIPLQIKVCRTCRLACDARLTACPRDQDTRVL